ncbi:MAG: HigA family addiction module antitoxin [Bryobacteraceae bacterium]
MSSTIMHPYEPDFVTPPGEMLEEKLQELGMSQAELAERIGRTKKTVNEIIKAKAPLLPETAIQLERVLGIPARFWSNAEANYRQWLAHQEEARRLGEQRDFLKELPTAQLVKAGWLAKRPDPVSRLRDVLQFFGVASLDALSQIGKEKCLAFRQSAAHEVNHYALLAWLRIGELEAQKIQCAPYDPKKFRRALQSIRGLCNNPVPEAAPQIGRACAESGVALVFVPEISGCRAWGVTQWVSPEKAILQLSLRGKTDDQFWFTFFHEAAHILLHPKKDIYVEIDNQQDKREQEAHAFARDILIPPEDWQKVTLAKPRGATEIKKWAGRLGIPAGVLVGRLQHERMLPWTHLNALKVKLRFAA